MRKNKKLFQSKVFRKKCKKYFWEKFWKLRPESALGCWIIYYYKVQELKTLCNVHIFSIRLYNFSVTSNFISFMFLENAIFKINTQKLKLIYTCYRKSKDFQFMVILRSPMDHAPPYKALNTKNLKKNSILQVSFLALA